MKKLLLTSIMFSAMLLNSSENLLARSISILSLNDLHGHTEPEILKNLDQKEFRVGGAEAISGYLNIVRKHNKNVLLFDAGDMFQGTMTANIFTGEPVIKMYNALGVKASTIGNHEFDYGGTIEDPVKILKKRISEANYPVLSANILDKKTKKTLGWKNLYQYKIIEIDGIKIGLTGLTTLQTPTTTKPEFVKNLYFADLKESLQKVVPQMRRKGADIVIVLAHLGASCPKPESSSCNKEDELVELLNKLPNKYVDLVISGHTHTVLKHEINGIPFVQSGSYSYNFTNTELTYDIEGKKAKNIKISMKDLIPLCLDFVGDTKACNKKTKGEITQAKYLEEAITPDENIIKMLKPYRDEVEKTRKTVVGETANTIKQFSEKFYESEMGNLVSDAMKESAGVDIAITNGGGIRSSLEKGPITYGDIFKVLPFENTLVKVKLTGKDLYNIIRIGTSGSHQMIYSAGLKYTVDENQDKEIKEDLNKNGKKELWERNNLFSLTLQNGEAIDMNKFYTIVTNDFIVSGGDDMAFVFDNLDKKNLETIYGKFLRDSLVEYFQKHKEIINTNEKPLIDKNNLRILKK